MKLIRIILAVAAAAVAVPGHPTFAGPGVPAPALLTRTLDGAVGYGTSLLEQKNYKQFIQEFAPPAEVKKIPDIDKAAEEFGLRQGEEALTAFKMMKGKKPKMSADGKKATFQITGKDGTKDEFEFTLIDGGWRIEK